MCIIDWKLCRKEFSAAHRKPAFFTAGDPPIAADVLCTTRFRPTEFFNRIGQEPSLKLVCTKGFFRIFSTYETKVVNLRFVEWEIRFRANEIAALDVGG